MDITRRTALRSLASAAASLACPAMPPARWMLPGTPALVTANMDLGRLLEVVDVASGEKMPLVYAAHQLEGWVERYIVRGGCLVLDEGGDPVKERIFVNFRLRWAPTEPIRQQIANEDAADDGQPPGDQPETNATKMSNDYNHHAAPADELPPLKTAEELGITEEQRVNLARLALFVYVYYTTMRSRDIGFSMSTYASINTLEDMAMGKHACGSSACLVGHAPLAGIGAGEMDRFVGKEGERWGRYASAMFGTSPVPTLCSIYRWLFAGSWANDPIFGAARIAYFLAEGLPEDNLRGLGGYAPRWREIESLARSRAWKPAVVIDGLLDGAAMRPLDCREGELSLGYLAPTALPTRLGRPGIPFRLGRPHPDNAQRDWMSYRYEYLVPAERAGDVGEGYRAEIAQGGGR